MKDLSGAVFCCKFWNDLPGLVRLTESLRGWPCIFVDGRWLNYGRGQPLSTDGSREYLIDMGYSIIDAPDMIEWQSRNAYIEEAQRLGYDYCIVIDSDEWVVNHMVTNELDGADAYVHRQEYNETWHPIYYRIHRTTARHRDRHQTAFINDRQIFTPDSPNVSLITAYDKELRDPEEERYRKQYYRDNPVR